MANTVPNQPTPEHLVAELMLLLNLEPGGPDRFIGRKHPEGMGRVFGGQAIAQALGAARHTVDDDRHTHSLHAYFLRPGTDDLPIEFRVKRDLDGSSFSNRRVVASQNGQAILNLTASFQKPQSGPSHQAAIMPDVPPPEDLRPGHELNLETASQLPDGMVKNILLRQRPIEFRPVEPRDYINPSKGPATAHCWFKVVAPLPNSPPIHRAILAYTSDFELLGTVLQPHGLSFHRGQVKTASLDHALWFHDDFRVDDWLLYATESPWSGTARGFGRGQIFSRDGRLIASVCQEGMIRAVPD